MEKCGIHENIEKSIERQENILESFRKENSAHQLYVTKALSEICSTIKEITEIKATQVANADRREKFAEFCENRRKLIWEEITILKGNQREFKGILVGVAAIGGVIGAFAKTMFEWLTK